MKKSIVLLLACVFMFFGCAEVPASVETTGGDMQTIETCAVSFDSQGGSAVETQVVACGGKVAEPSAPTKKCQCEFDGWYFGDEKWSFVGHTVTEDMTLTAKWVKCYECFGLNYKEYNIIIDSNIFKKYAWRDIEDIQKCDSYYKDIDGNKISNLEDAWEYKIIFKDGYIFTITIGKSYV